MINFDAPHRSHRCNPINPTFMTDISDTYESAYTIMLNLNRSWIQKQGDFFVELPIILLGAIIWFLKIYEKGKYCTFPNAIEFLNQPYNGFSRYSFPTMSLPTTFCPLWTLGKVAHKSSCGERLYKRRYRSQGWFRLPFIRWWQMMISRSISTILTSRKYWLWATIPNDKTSIRLYLDFTIAVS